ncbi:hypothetical protein LCGC14_0709320 [marine sediment metagenome]|uniref:SHSP domain-containing protein n=1 Tax=marine sediment metagenome TaxID=412755 RepID=A0A0F9QFH9_9ZZZZ
MFSSLFDLFPNLDAPLFRHRPIEFHRQYRWPVEPESPQADIQTTETAVLVRLDLPGMRRDDVKIETEDRQLIIRGTRKPPDDQLDVQERWSGDFERRFTLAEYLDQDNITAKLQDGVLTVTVPRQPEAKPRQIKIETE